MQRGISRPERRHLTVLFSDMVGYSRLSSRLDPEDLRDLLRQYQEVCTSEIERFEGVVSRYVGDGVISLFGFPHAHEDDSERAVNAGLAIVDRIPSLDVGLGPEIEIRIEARVGIATGVVVAGDLIGKGLSEEVAVVGETPNLAARLQQVAQPNSVVVHDTTKELAGAHFEYEDLGTQILKGFSEPVQAWQVLGRRSDRSRFEAAHPANLTSLVGREADLLALSECWDLAVGGQGQTVLLTGEAGVGKSRLAQALDEGLEPQTYTRVRLQCSSYHRKSSLHPFIEQLKWAAGLTSSDTLDDKFDRLKALVKQSGLEFENAMPLLVRLLSLPAGGRRYAIDTMSSPQQRERTLTLLVDRLRHAASSKPLLVILEDVQWADPTSLELTDRMVDCVRSERIMLVITHRPDPDRFTPSWKERPYVMEKELERLSSSDAALLATDVAKGVIPTQLVDEIVARADGVPLFIEEVTKNVIARRSQSPPARFGGQVSVPMTLRETLTARLDQVGAAKVLAQYGASIGRSFSYTLLAAATQFPTEELDDGMNRLVEAGLLYQEGQPPDASYSFKHALVQEAAYESLLQRTERPQLHGQIADAMVSRFPELVKNQPEIVARHHWEALRFPESAKSWFLAGKAAIERSANKEAAAHCKKALASLDRISDRQVGTPRELSIQLNLGVALLASEGFASPNVEAAYGRARELCEAAGDAPETFLALCGLGSFYTVRADLDTARGVAQQMLKLGRINDDAELLLWGHVALGATQLHSGQIESAKRHLEKGVALYDPREHGHHGFLYGQDPAIIGHCHLAWSAWFMGNPDEAIAHISSAIQMGEQMNNAFSHAYSLVFAAWLAQFLGRSADCRRRADEAIAKTTEQEFQLLLGMALVAKGWSLTMDGDARAGVEAIQDGIDSYQRTGAALGVPAMLAMLAFATAKTGNTGKALEIAKSALALAVDSGQLLFEAELHRLIAELSLETAEGLNESAQSPIREDARKSAAAAANTASRQGALALMLRAALTHFRTALTTQDHVSGLSELANLCLRFDDASTLPEYLLARRLIDQG